MLDLRHIAALLATGRMTPKEAVKLGEQLLVEGDDRESIVALASLSPGAYDRAIDLLRGVLHDLGIELPDAQDGAFWLGLEEVRSIASGAVDPIEGALWIWREVWSDYRFPEFSGFVALVDDLDEALAPSDRNAVADEIVLRAKQMSGL
jgi:hypothetical protein